MSFISSLTVILIGAGLLVLAYVIGGIIDALERYVTNRRKARAKEKAKTLRRV